MTEKRTPIVKVGQAAQRASDGLDRRSAMKLFATGAGLALASCGKPLEEIVPYVDIPEGLTPGVPLKFATALPLGGYARGVLVHSVEGRPTKVEGNPRHPASLGATDVFAEASVLSLYDPDRSRAPRNRMQPVAWEVFLGVLQAQMQHEKARAGAGLRVLTGRITSPTLRAQLKDLLHTMPEARWHRYEPVNDDAALRGAVLAFGRPVVPIPRLAEVRAVLALDADPLGPGPQQIRMARDFSEARRAPSSHQEILRLYAAEPAWSLTGANADHRLAVPPQLVRNVALALANELGANLATGDLPIEARRFAQHAARDLKARMGRALVMVGESQAPEVHALVHWINAELHAPVDLIDPVDIPAPAHADSLRALADDLAARRVETLVIVGANPAYDAPGRLGLGEAIASVPFGVHLGLYDDETAALCKWHLPLSHTLESWSDLRALDGTASIVQPLIRPLYASRTAHQLVAHMAGAQTAESHNLVRQHWHSRASGDFEDWWNQCLHEGVVPNTSLRPISVPMAKLPTLAPGQTSPNVALVVQPSPAIFDGCFSNSAWLQECPQPLTKQVWGNAVHLSPHDGRKLGLADGDVVRLGRGKDAIEAPVLIQPGQADGVLGSTFGYGRTHAGTIGNRVGFSVHPLQDEPGERVLENIAVVPTGRRQELLSTQHQYRLDGEASELLPVLKVADLVAGKHIPAVADDALPTLYPAHNYHGYAWSMVIDTSACIGCNACVVACQAENNVPIVGPEEIGIGRDMHWLRIDTYFTEGAANPPGFQPVPCMHCEHAPCEPVCPVMASIHDSEGLNLQVYNRCIGTRFCQSNCPYKVRRFNFFGYADGQEYANLGADVVKLQFNPDVTVRARGVMEKCTYCVQRISGARRTAEKESRSIRPGEVTTACQDACPTRAISFGNRNDRSDEVNVLRKGPRHYELLGHLGTRPRTTYLARLLNPNPALAEDAS
jgi:molybdopterin-containing oxidoreductase family iron-sulfur binding subunit